MMPTLGELRVLALGAVTAVFLGCHGKVAYECPSSEPEELQGFETGFATCGLDSHRVEAITCPVFDHTPPASCADDPESDCTADSECDAHFNGICEARASGGCGCTYGCGADEDCDEGEICRCGDPISKCIVASCVTDADCPREGSLCVESPATICGGDPIRQLGCTLDVDQCLFDSDCDEADARCILDHDGVRRCHLPSECALP